MTTSATKRLCLIHANCQGDPLCRFLLSSPGFAAQWRVCHVINHTRQDLPPELLESCDLFLYQRIGEKWGTLASDYLLERLPATATAMQIPNAFFLGYWPFWTNKYPTNFADRVLEALLERDLSRKEILHLYLHTDTPFRFIDPLAIFAESLEVERAKEKDCVVKTVDFVLERWRTEPMFSTINHPSPLLLRHIVCGILDALALPPLPALERLPQVSCDPDFDLRFELPIHPGVAERQQLTFTGPQTRYQVFDKWLTFAEYAACYVDCRLLGMDNFLAYLRQIRLK